MKQNLITTCKYVWRYNDYNALIIICLIYQSVINVPYKEAWKFKYMAIRMQLSKI